MTRLIHAAFTQLETEEIPSSFQQRCHLDATAFTTPSGSVISVLDTVRNKPADLSVL
jgi:hypothetical protein